MYGPVQNENRDLCSKSDKTFRMVTASTEPRAGPSKARDPVPPQRLHDEPPVLVQMGEGKGHDAVIVFENCVGSQFRKKIISLIFDI